MRNGILRFVACLFIGVVIVLLSSCNKEDDPQAPELGSITGEVTDNDGQAIADVDVTVSSVNEDDISVATDADGSFLVENLPLKTHTVTFSKAGWLTVSTTVSANQFDDNNAATADATMVNTSAKISGTVTDAKNNDAPLSGVSVSTESDTTTTGEDGTFLIENLLEGDYTITFTKDTYETVTEGVVAADFVDGVATVDVTMGADEVLRGFTQEDLLNADKWYYNEYRGGRNADAYPHWDWATDYMSALDFQGAWQEQNEGTTLQIRNGEEDQGNPANLDVFDSFVYGSKLITEDNKILSVRLRTHDADEAAPAYYGVQVVDLSAAQPEAVKVGENRTYGSEDYADVEFDLSAYVGKEVIVAIGIYRQATGDYWKQLVLRAIRFAGQKVEGTDWLPGTAVVPEWEQLTLENLRSTMPHTKSSFTGISPVGGDRDNYVDGYRAWRDINHIAAEWALVPLKKDPEVFASEGYIIKTRDTPEVSTTVPEAYMYAKFSIASGSNQMTLRTRNFGANPTYFKLTAVQSDGTVTHIAPTSNTAQQASAAEDGCWMFIHEEGSVDNPEGYASFVYDLSQFDGEDVTLAYGVYNGVAESGENKLVFYSIELN